MEKKRILVIDDSKAYRQAIRKELEAEGYLVEEAADGFQALVRLGRPPAPDLIALDVEMPRLNGFEVCKRLSDEHYGRHFGNRRPPVVFVTSNDGMECREKGFELGAADFVTKPFKPGAIAETVKKALSDNRLGRGLAALVVDDSAAARKIVADCLKQEGIEVFEAKDGQCAFDMLKEMKDGIDLVITDLLMPVMDGRELVGKIRRELNLDSVPVICLTAVEERAELLSLFKAGASDYLVKPFPKEELLARINVHLERTQLTKRLSAMVEELKNLNRMKDNYLAVCSHDLRSPLTGILGFADLLLSKDYLREDDRDGLEEIKASGVALLGFIDDILDLGKARSSGYEPKMERVRLSEVVADSVSVLRHSAAVKDQDLEFVNLCSDEDFVRGNGIGLNRVMNNLISNAIKYTPKGGRISVSLSDTDDGGVRVEVSDNGIGIPRDKLSNLFDPFTQFHQLGASGEYGVGLGMSIVKEILDGHGAEIEVQSAPGEGTRCTTVFQRTEFAEEIPPKAESNPAEGVVAETGESPGAKKGVVLLAEDDELHRRLSDGVLSSAGFDAEIARNGKQAVEMFFADPGKYDFVLLDCRMPVMNGIEAAKRIRGQGYDSVPIFALTANSGKEETSECLRAGMNDVLGKPLTLNSVSEAFSRFRFIEGGEKSDGKNPDLKQIADSLGFDEAKCAKYLKLFCDSAKKYWVQLSEAFEDGDFEKAADAFHTIKGGAMSMKLEKVRDMAERLEKMAKMGFLDEIRQETEALESELRKIGKIAILQ